MNWEKTRIAFFALGIAGAAALTFLLFPVRLVARDADRLAGHQEQN